MDLSAPLYLRELVKKKNKSANTRLADDSFLLVPPISKGSSNIFFKLSFIYAAPTEWNKLNGRIGKITKLTHLNVKLKQLYYITVILCYYYVVFILTFDNGNAFYSLLNLLDIRL